MVFKSLCKQIQGALLIRSENLFTHLSDGAALIRSTFSF
ncbi:hypothetical protein HCH_03100 [Hahella chejuensis KCTC 2396]|uniref:Uncharacterized protein n=1 Tax=Hahella chejuensis (strain KCTC 2396) TaxID=349521 RepID=Q2SHK8_HAHCH|nr:hypothetical protein HCH_03100 [Hahella chejuensis KCTC 2396]